MNTWKHLWHNNPWSKQYIFEHIYLNTTATTTQQQNKQQISELCIMLFTAQMRKYTGGQKNPLYLQKQLFMQRGEQKYTRI